MSLLDKARRHWISVTLYFVFSLFFLGSAMVSINTYSSIIGAQREIALQNPAADVTVLPNGSLEFTFSIELKNPSRYVLHAASVSWAVRLENESSQADKLIPLGSGYSGSTSGVRALAHSVKTFSYTSVVSDPATIAKLNGFIVYASSHGNNYTLTTLPYTNSFSITVNIGEFKHDFLREGYLNDLVTKELTYPEVSV